VSAVKDLECVPIAIGDRIDQCVIRCICHDLSPYCESFPSSGVSITVNAQWFTASRMGVMAVPNCRFFEARAWGKCAKATFSGLESRPDRASHTQTRSQVPSAAKTDDPSPTIEIRITMNDVAKRRMGRSLQYRK